MKRKILQSNSGITLVEVMIVAGILAFSISAMLRLFIQTSVQSSISGNKTAAVGEVQGKIEEIREYAYDNIVADYASGGAVGDSFALASINGVAKIYIDNSATYIAGTSDELLGVIITASWEDKYGRIIGEDTDLDGVLDLGEDANGNGRLDSPVMLATLLTRR